MLTNKKPLIEIVFKDVSYMVESKFQFKAGTHHVLNITVNNNPDKVKIEKAPVFQESLVSEIISITSIP